MSATGKAARGMKRARDEVEACVGAKEASGSAAPQQAKNNVQTAHASAAVCVTSALVTRQPCSGEFGERGPVQESS
jgi:hypothetical protein